jgi:ribosomal protein S1
MSYVFIADLEHLRGRTVSCRVGDQVEGTIKNVADFGALVDLGGAVGLLHFDGRRPAQPFQIDERVTVVIQRIEPETKTIWVRLRSRSMQVRTP